MIVFGGTAVTMNAQSEEIGDAVIEIKNGKIASLRSQPGYKPPAGAKAVDATNCLVTPGFVNAHTHTGMTFLRGIGDDMPLKKWLTEKIFPLERKWGNPEFVYWGTLLAAAEMIRSGTTLFNDMYYYEEYASKAAHEAGLRMIAGQAIIEIGDVEEKKSDVFSKFEEFLAKIESYPLVQPALAPHSIYGVSDKLWREVVKYAHERKLAVHVHLAETQEEEDQCQRKIGKTPTEYFEEIGLWEGMAIAAHATCVTPAEIEILGRRKVGVAHNPESNLKLGTKICPVVELRKAGANVALGTDGVASNNNLDLLQEADTAAKLQIYRKEIGALTAKATVKMLTSEGARAVGMGDVIGTLEVGKSADMVAVDLEKPHAVPLYNPYSHLVYAASGQDVKHTLVAGRVLMENYRLTTLDEAAILREAKAWGKRIAV